MRGDTVILGVISMARKNSTPQVPYIFLIIITMTALALFVQLDRMQNKSSEIRTKAYQQTSSGIRIEAEEMTVSGGVTKNSEGGYIQF